MAPHSSTLAWRIPWTEEPGGLQSLGSRGVGINICIMGFPVGSVIKNLPANAGDTQDVVSIPTTTARSIPGLTARAGSEGSLSSGLSCSHLRVHTLALAVLINYFLDDATALPISMRLPQCDSHRDGVQIPC